MAKITVTIETPDPDCPESEAAYRYALKALRTEAERLARGWLLYGAKIAATLETEEE